MSSPSPRISTTPKVVKPFIADVLSNIALSSRPFSIEIIGEPDVGKSHFADSFPKALHLDTEKKADITIEKFPQAGHIWKKVSKWDDIEDAVNWAVTQPDIKSVIIDNDDDIQDLAVEKWSDEHGGKRPIAFDAHGGVITVLYAQIYKMIDDVKTAIENSGKYLVCTCRLKDEFIANINTGRRVRDGYKKFPWSLKMALWIKNGIPDKKSGQVMFKQYKFGEVVKNNFFGIDMKKTPPVTYKKPYVFDVSYEGICEEMLKPWGGTDGVPLSEENERILKEAGEWLKVKGLI